jgi:hypothetical protein
MSALHLGLYQPGLAYGCCPANVFACVFNESNYALKLVTQSPDMWLLTEYSKTDHSEFCIPLTEHEERTHYYYINLDDTQFILTTSGYGQYYTVEYWYKSSVQSFGRELNTFLTSEKFMWDSVYKRKVDSMIGITQESLISNVEVKASVAYDSANQIIRIIAWLERAGALVADTKVFNFHWYDFNGDEITSGSRTFHIPNVNGVFKMEIGGVDTIPDMTTPMIASIIDIDDLEYTSCVSIVSYD